MSATHTLRVFVSYEMNGAREHAEAAFEALQAVGVEAWVWHLGRRSGAYLWTEIAERIAEADYVLFICTSGTRASSGQTFEVNNALNQEKEVWVLTLDKTFVPPALLGRVWDETTADDVGLNCKKLVQRLGQPTWPVIDSPTPRVKDENTEVILEHS